MERIWQAQLHTIYLAAIVTNPLPAHSHPQPHLQKNLEGKEKACYAANGQLQKFPKQTKSSEIQSVYSNTIKKMDVILPCL